MFALPGDLLEKKDEYLATIKNLQNKLSEELIISKKDMIERIKVLKLDFEELQMRTELHELDDIYLKFYNMYHLIQQMQQECNIINKRERKILFYYYISISIIIITLLLLEILKWEQTDFSELEKVFKVFNPYYRVWHQAKDYSIKIPVKKPLIFLKYYPNFILNK